MALNSTTTTVESEELASPARGDMIVVEDLWRTYDMGSEQQVQALRGVSCASSTTSMWPSWDRPAPANPP